MISRVSCLLLLVLILRAGADDQVRSAQEELRRRNLYFGDVDGRRSGEYEEALKRYQKRKGFNPSGHDDADTVRSLGLTTRAPNDPKPKELDWPEEPVLKSDVKVNVVRESSELAAATGVAPETFQPADSKLVPIAASEQRKRQRALLARTRSPRTTNVGPRPTEGAVQQSINPQEAIKFIKEYLRATERGDLRAELCFYADRVDYFSNGMVDRRVVEHSIRKYYSRWPHRKSRLVKVLGFRVQPVTAQITLTFQVDFTLRNKGKRVKGATVNQIVLNAATSSPRIVAIRENRVRH